MNDMTMHDLDPFQEGHHSAGEFGSTRSKKGFSQEAASGAHLHFTPPQGNCDYFPTATACRYPEPGNAENAAGVEAFTSAIKTPQQLLACLFCSSQPCSEYSAFSGKIRSGKFFDLLQFLVGTSRTGRLLLSVDDDEGHLWLAHGRLKRATTDSLTGMDALIELLGWGDLNFAFLETDIHFEPNLPDHDAFVVLMEALTLLDTHLREEQERIERKRTELLKEVSTFAAQECAVLEGITAKEFEGIQEFLRLLCPEKLSCLQETRKTARFLEELRGRTDLFMAEVLSQKALLSREFANILIELRSMLGDGENLPLSFLHLAAEADDLEGEVNGGHWHAAKERVLRLRTLLFGEMTGNHQVVSAEHQEKLLNGHGEGVQFRPLPATEVLRFFQKVPSNRMHILKAAIFADGEYLSALLRRLMGSEQADLPTTFHQKGMVPFLRLPIGAECLVYIVGIPVDQLLAPHTLQAVQASDRVFLGYDPRRSDLDAERQAFHLLLRQDLLNSTHFLLPHHVDAYAVTDRHISPLFEPLIRARSLSVLDVERDQFLHQFSEVLCNQSSRGEA